MSAKGTRERDFKSTRAVIADAHLKIRDAILQVRTEARSGRAGV